MSWKIISRLNCESCGGSTDHQENEICEGALLEERQQTGLDLVDCKGLTTCHCCDTCRVLCAKDWFEEQETA